ncbi:MAG: alpha/beta hydrolase, partial [Anaerolineae bacterium]|nr:alpha/beta hydrolase [Anaerolineae bacterium]
MSSQRPVAYGILCTQNPVHSTDYMNSERENSLSSSTASTLAARLQQFRASVPLNSLQLGKHTWTYYETGDPSEEALLLLHGSGGTAETMFRYIEGFGANFHVVAPNLPASISQLGDAVAGLQALLQHIGIQKAHVIGFSFGAMLAQMFVRRFPDAVLDLILTHTMIPSEHLAERANMQRALIAFYPEALLLWLSRRSFRSNLQKSRTPAPEPDRAFWQGYFAELYNNGYRKRDILARSRLTCQFHVENQFSTKDLNRWNGNLLLIESSADEVIEEGDRGALKGMYPQAYVQTL